MVLFAAGEAPGCARVPRTSPDGATVSSQRCRRRGAGGAHTSPACNWRGPHPPDAPGALFPGAGDRDVEGRDTRYTSDAGPAHAPRPGRACRTQSRPRWSPSPPRTARAGEGSLRPACWRITTVAYRIVTGTSIPRSRPPAVPWSIPPSIPCTVVEVPAVEGVRTPAGFLVCGLPLGARECEGGGDRVGCVSCRGRHNRPGHPFRDPGEVSVSAPHIRVHRQHPGRSIRIDRPGEASPVEHTAGAAVPSRIRALVRAPQR